MHWSELLLCYVRFGPHSGMCAPELAAGGHSVCAYVLCGLERGVPLILSSV